LTRVFDPSVGEVVEAVSDKTVENSSKGSLTLLTDMRLLAISVKRALVPLDECFFCMEFSDKGILDA